MLSKAGPLATTSESIRRLEQNLRIYITPESRRKALQFKPRDSDVFIVTYPKCGTTWMQQILHQLKTGGDMSFDEITEKVPFLELAYDVRIDLERDQVYPRCYKTHCPYDDCPKGAKYIVVYREPCCAIYSLYTYAQGWLIQPPGDVTLDEFVHEFALRRSPTYFEHFLSWWKHRDDPNVLLLFYEDLKDDLAAGVAAVARFVGIVDDAKIKNAIRTSTFQFMKENSTKFNGNIVRNHRNLSMCNLFDDTRTSDKVVTGSTTKALKKLPNYLQNDIQEKWRLTVGKATGYQSYGELRRAFRARNPLNID